MSSDPPGKAPRLSGWMEEVRGRLEAHARSPAEAADGLRRAGVLVPLFVREEELGIRPEDALPLGRLSPLTTVTNFYVEPFVAAIPQPYDFRPAEAEIAQVLEIPVADLMDPSALERRPLPGRAEPVLFYHHPDGVIWGATARMLAELLEALKENR
jgi:hypothetical protein